MMRKILARSLTFVVATNLAACQGGFAWQTNASGAGANGSSGSATSSGTVTVDGVSSQALASDLPSVTVIRRLSNLEYANTVRDLLGTKLTPAANFIADDITNNFDTIGATLQVSPTLVLGYLTAAEILSVEASDPKTSGIANDIACLSNENDTVCLNRVLSNLAEKAWRRPVTTQEMQQVITAAGAATDKSYQGQLAMGIETLLLSPHFLFHVELDANPSGTGVAALSDFELASRLSYFLWSSMPDAVLYAAAKNGSLHDDAVLGAQIDRMLADPRSQNLVTHFASFWLGLPAAAKFTADASQFPNFNSNVRSAMITETQTFLQDYIMGDMPVARMVDANYTFVNGTLASYYGIQGVSGDTFSKVALPTDVTTPRKGVLTQGAVLISTSDPGQTNLIRRGKAVLNNILCVTIGPPPANAGVLPTASSEPNQTARQRLEGHVTNPACASCHSLMDPIGYAFEKFGPDGMPRTTDNGSPIDSSGTYNGQPFAGADTFVPLLAQSTSIDRCTVRTLYTYALGIVPSSTDIDTLNHLLDAYTSAGGKMKSLVKLTALSNVFRSRKAQGSAS